MMKQLFDSNILIDYLRGYEQARLIIDDSEHKFVSIISFIEVFVGNKTDEPSLRLNPRVVDKSFWI